jgi:DNA-binding transcriptional MerR regulator
VGHKIPAPRPGYQADEIRELIRELNGATRDARIERAALDEARREAQRERDTLDDHITEMVNRKGKEVGERIEREILAIKSFFDTLNRRVREQQAHLLGAKNSKELLKDLREGVIAAIVEQLATVQQETEARQVELMKDINRRLARMASR